MCFRRVIWPGPKSPRVAQAKHHRHVNFVTYYLVAIRQRGTTRDFYIGIRSTPNTEVGSQNRVHVLANPSTSPMASSLCPQKSSIHESGISPASGRRKKINRIFNFSFFAADGEELALSWMENLRAQQMSPSQPETSMPPNFIIHAKLISILFLNSGFFRNLFFLKIDAIR